MEVRRKEMNIKTFNNKSDQEKFNSKNSNSDCFDVKIQCPNCGSIFILNNNREYFCEICNRVYAENEIRTHCGL